MNQATASQPLRKAFTLLEVLVAVAILSLLVAIMAAMAAQIHKAWTQGRMRMENFQNGRAILEFIARDLAAASISPQLQMLQNPAASGGGNLDPLLPSGQFQIPNSDSLFWQAPFSGNNYGNLCEIGFFLVEDSSSSPSRYQLMRFYAVPDNKAVGAADHFFRVLDSAPLYNTTAWLTGLNATQFQQCLAPISEGVLAFWIRCLDANGDPIPWLGSSSFYSAVAPLKYNSAASFSPAQAGTPDSFQYSAPPDPSDPTKPSTLPAHRLPYSVELTIVTLDAQTLKRPGLALPDIPSAADETEVPDSIQAFLDALNTANIKTAQLFTTTVKLANEAP